VANRAWKALLRYKYTLKPNPIIMS